jgi:hypothetical protein
LDFSNERNAQIPIWYNLFVRTSICRICRKHHLNVVHFFYPIPYGDLYKDDQKAALSLQSNDLTLVRCNNCGLLQLDETTRFEEQYSEYLYFTSVTNKLNSFYKRIAGNLINYLKLLETDHVLDIGSNDGSFLEHFSIATSNLHGVDPAKPACEVAIAKNLFISNTFFEREFCETFLRTNSKPRLITCNYTIANMPNLQDFFESLRLMMSSDTLFNVITGYHLDQFDVGMFEYVNHDHQTYLTLHDFAYLAEKNGMKVVYFRRHEHKGGSAEVGITLKDSTFIVDDSVSQNLQRETWLDSRSNSSIFSMVSRTTEYSRTVNSFLDAFKSDGCQIFGIGASISSTSLISEFGLSDRINTIYDDDVRKHGKYSPGTGIPVLPLSEISVLPEKSVVMILSWQHTDRFFDRLQEIGFSGFVIVPLPFPRLRYLSS